MKGSKLLNFTTAIDESKSMGEIIALLSMKGARQVSIDYDDSKRPAGICFTLALGNKEKPILLEYRLPCKFEQVLTAMRKQQVRAGLVNQEQARRVAWRVLKSWIEAQLAMIDIEMAQMAQVFMPYALRNDGRTMYDHFAEALLNPSRALAMESESQ